MKFQLSILTSVMALLILQGCSPVGEATSSPETNSSQVDSSSSFDTASLGRPPRTTNPAPAPAPTPAPPPGPVADYVCTHSTGISYCNTKDLSVNIDQMEKYVRATNKSANRNETICLPTAPDKWRANPNYPISWACGSALSNASPFNVETTQGYYPSPPLQDRPIFNYSTRFEIPVRPANGYRSLRHFNAPFRCYGADPLIYISYVGEDTIYDRNRTNLLCYFSLNQLPAEALADAVAEAREFANLETTNFHVNCATKIRMIGPQAAKNIPVNVLECSYDDAPPGGTGGFR